jgi:crotonobetainyl-CoA:carnitine CoA-transferase CaiB-like acyl-CoA transferase
VVVHALAARCDIVVEGFRPGVVRRLGIDFETLAAHNPHLVYCSISGYGQQGERQALTGHDLTYASMTGLLDALFPGHPQVPGVQLVDAAAAFLAAIRILAALRNSGAGPQFLDVTLAQGARALMPLVMAETLSEQPPSPSLVETLRGSARNNLYRCADGRWLALTPLEESFWQQLHLTLRSAGLLSAEERLTQRRLEEIILQRPCREWFALLSNAGIPCAPVQSVGEAVHGTDTASGLGVVGDFGDPPLLGADTAAWLRELGYSEERIARLAERQVILVSPDNASAHQAQPGN